MLLPLSVFIIAKNEADRIARTIKSVQPIADEVIVIDSNSTDGTLELAQALGARVIVNPWPGYGLQKRFGEAQCKHRWLLSIDADEELTPELADEIRALFASGEPPLAGYVLQIRDMLPGEESLSPTSHTNHVLRLYDRQKAEYSDSPVHDSVILREGQTMELKHPVLHRSFRNVGHAIDKLNSYSDVQSDYLKQKSLRFARLRLLSEFPISFVKVYFIRGYITRGWAGFIYAVVYAFGRFARIAKAVE